MTTISEQPPISSGASFRERLWVLLNSPFVVFLFGSVIISSISFAYQRISEAHEKNNQLTLTETHLKTEIIHRIEDFAPLKRKSFSFTDMYTFHGALLGVEGNSSLNGLVGNFSPLYSEYGHESLVSLLTSLQEKISTDTQREPIKKLIGDAEYIDWAFDNITMIEGVEPGVHDSIWQFKDKVVYDKTLEDSSEIEKFMKKQ